MKVNHWGVFYYNFYKHKSFLFSGISKLNITSGTRTYRIPSPTRPLITRNSFQAALPVERIQPVTQVEDQEPENEKGFYISFDNEQPKRPKPPLRTKKGSPRKEHSFSEISDSQERQERMLSENQRQLQRELDLERRKKEEEMERRREDEMVRQRDEDIARRREEMRNENIHDQLETSQERTAGASAIIIGTDLKNPDPVRIFIILMVLAHLDSFRIWWTKEKGRKKKL